MAESICWYLYIKRVKFAFIPIMYWDLENGERNPMVCNAMKDSHKSGFSTMLTAAVFQLKTKCGNSALL